MGTGLGVEGWGFLVVGDMSDVVVGKRSVEAMPVEESKTSPGMENGSGVLKGSVNENGSGVVESDVYKENCSATWSVNGVCHRC